MGAQENAATLRAINEAFNNRDPDAAAARCAPDFENLNVPTGEILRGPDGLRQFFQQWYTAFPDGKVKTKMVYADDTGGAIEFVGRGTQTGPLSSPAGPIPPTGRPTEIAFVSMNEMRDGRVVRSRLYYDVASMLRQLGLMPAPAQMRAGS